MNIFIDNKSGLPIYDQIYSQIKSQIINGALQEDEALPSIRNLAKDLRISVITTKRAYEELEKEGFIYTVPAKGCYVSAKNTELLYCLILDHSRKCLRAHSPAAESQLYLPAHANIRDLFLQMYS